MHIHLHKYYFERLISAAIFSDAISVTPINMFFIINQYLNDFIFDSKNIVIRIVSYNRK